jgi:hypothetical protein
MRLSSLSVLFFVLILALASAQGDAKLNRKLEKLRQEAEALRQEIAQADETGQVAIKTNIADANYRLQKLLRKIEETEGKPKAEKTITMKQPTEEQLTKERFWPYYVNKLRETGSPCLKFAEAKMAKRHAAQTGEPVAEQPPMSLEEKAQMKLENSKCKVEKSELFVQFVQDEQRQKAAADADANQTEQ